MEADVPTTPGPVSPPDPPQDQPGKTAPVPEYIAAVLYAVSILLGYGRHLLGTIERRATAPTFPTIAACFGTANLSTILAHLNRGILRAAALERYLLARAATGRDIVMVTRRSRTDDEPSPAPADAQPEPPTAPSAAPKPARRPSLPSGSDNPEFFMPTPEDFDRQVRRRAIGRTIGEICSDLAVVPGHCTSAFWNGLFELMHYFGGDGIATVMREKSRREQTFIQEQDRKLDSTWDWLQLKRNEIRERLGFFIGEPPVDPFAAALATGPP
jgi:hypothetical protein